MPRIESQNFRSSSGSYNSPSTASGSSEFGKLYGNIQAGLKTAPTPGSIEEVKAKCKELTQNQIKFVLANAQRLPLPGDEGSDSFQAMENSMNGYMDMLATDIYIDAQAASIAAMKNPPVDLMKLKNKQVEYKDNIKFFAGDTVNYGYKISHTEGSCDALINLTFIIRDQKGTALRTARQTVKASSCSGNNFFAWDGKDDAGSTVEEDTYTMEVQAEGVKSTGGIQTRFPVRAESVLSGKVEGVKFDKGTATAIVIDGKTVMREQICNIQDINITPAADYSPGDLIGKNVKVNLTRAQIKQGSIEIYFDNHIEKTGGITFKIFDSDNRFVKTLTSSKTLDVGIAKMSFNNHGLADGDYNVKTFVTDISAPENPVNVELNYDLSLFVTGVNKRAGTFSTFGEENYSYNNIDSITGDFTSPLERKSNSYIGTQVIYKDNVFAYNPPGAEKVFMLDKPQEEGILLCGQMMVYDNSDNKPVAIVRVPYKPYYYLSDESAAAILDLINARGYSSYDDLPPEEMLSINREIEEQIADGYLTLQERYLKDYNTGIAGLTFPAWDGRLEDGSTAISGKEYRREFTPIYIKNDGTNFFGPSDYEKSASVVISVNQKDKKLFLNLNSGRTITEDQILTI